MTTVRCRRCPRRFSHEDPVEAERGRRVHESKMHGLRSDRARRPDVRPGMSNLFMRLDEKDRARLDRAAAAKGRTVVDHVRVWIARGAP